MLLGVVVAIVDAEHHGDVGVGRGSREHDLLRAASRCFWPPSRLFGNVRTTRGTTSTPSSAHGRSAGSRSAVNLISCPPTLMKPSPASTVSRRVPRVESCFKRCAMVFESPMSFAATISKSPSFWSCARRKLRPILPNPLMPTLIFAMVLPFVFVRFVSTSSLARVVCGEVRRRPHRGGGFPRKYGATAATTASRRASRGAWECGGPRRQRSRCRPQRPPGSAGGPSDALRAPPKAGPEGKLRGRPSPPVEPHPKRGDGRGLNPSPDERGPAGERV